MQEMPELCLEDCVICRAGMGQVACEGQPRHGAVVVAVRAVVPPHGEEDILHLCLAACLDAWNDGLPGKGMVIPEEPPCPDSRAHHGFASKRAVPGNPLLVELLVGIVVVPVDEFDVLRNLPDHLLGNHALLVVVVVGLASAPEIHVRPHHWFEPVPAAYFHHLAEVAVDDIEARLLPVKLLELPVADAVRLVHPKVDSSGTDAILPGYNHLLDEFVCLRLVHKQDAIEVVDVLVAIPAEHLLQVCEGLDAGNHLDSQGRRIVVNLLDFLRGIRAPHQPEEWLALNVVGVLGVEHQHVVAEDCQAPHVAFEVGQRHHRIPGAVEHDAEHPEWAVLLRARDNSRDDVADHPQRHRHGAVCNLKTAGNHPHRGDRRISATPEYKTGTSGTTAKHGIVAGQLPQRR